MLLLPRNEIQGSRAPISAVFSWLELGNDKQEFFLAERLNKIK